MSDERSKINMLLFPYLSSYNKYKRRRSFREVIYYAEMIYYSENARQLDRALSMSSRSRNFVVSPKISETRLHRETGSFETGPL